MEDIDDSDVPDTGAVFTYGLSRFGDNEPGKFWVRNEKALQIACGEEHTIVTVESGRAFSFGKNDWGQLGIGNSSQLHTKPMCIKALKSSGEKVRLVACGRNHTILATASGSLYGVGNNSDMQLGVESDSDIVTSPILIEEGKDYVMLSAGGEMTAALLKSGEVFTWGSNSEGQCGVGSLDMDPISRPTRVRLPGKAICISCGYYHAAAVLADGRLFTWGESDGGKLGLGPDTHFSQESPQEVSVPESLCWVSCGNNHTVAVSTSGRLYTWGEGPSGQLGLGEHEDVASEPRLVKFSSGKVSIKVAEAGDNHTIAISKDGRLFSFGDARHGKLGVLAADQDTQIVWRPTEVLRFPDSKLSVEKGSCGGCHTVLLGGWRKEEIREAEEIVPASVVDVQSKPEPTARRRNRQRNSNGGVDSEMPRRLNQSLPPLRRPSNKDQFDEGFGSQSSTRQGEKLSNDAGDQEELKKENGGKTSFDNLLMKSKSSSSSAYAFDDKSSSQFRKRPSLRDESDNEQPANQPNKTTESRSQKGEDDMTKESTKTKKRGKGGMFGKKSALYDDDEVTPDEEEDEKVKEKVASSENRLSKASDHTTFPDPPAAEESNKTPIDDNTIPPESATDSQPVRVGCGGGGRSNNGNEKSKSCTML